MSRLEELFAKIRKQEAEPAGPISFVIAGLGNPGAEYERTRHNAGFWVLDALAKEVGVSVSRLRFRALVGEATVGGVRVLLLKPQTYMNLSGEAVAEALRFYKLTPDRLLVISDDVQLDEGVLRIRRRGSSGGQKGLGSIIEQLGTEDFARLRVGVGKKPHPEYDMSAFVLGTPTPEQRRKIDEAIPRAVEAVKTLLAEGIDRAMCLFSK